MINNKFAFLSLAGIITTALTMSACGGGIKKPEEAEQRVADDEAQLETMEEAGVDDPEAEAALKQDEAEADAEIDEAENARNASRKEEAIMNSGSE